MISMQWYYKDIPLLSVLVSFSGMTKEETLVALVLWELSALLSSLLFSLLSSLPVCLLS